MMGKLNALETLRIMDCNSLEVVFVEGTDVEDRPADASSTHESRPVYCRSLGSVIICRCKSLQKIFPASVAKGLQKLCQLTLEGCCQVEEIIFSEGLETTPPQFVFPKVTSARFYDMPKLNRFYPGMHASKWPLLKKLHVAECDKVKVLAAELPIFGEKHELDPLIEQSFFLIDKDSFPNLEKLTLGAVEIWYGPSPSPFFSKLKSISFYCCSPFSKQAALLFVQKLQKFDTLKVMFDDSEEINSDAVGTLPTVKHLKLDALYNLLHLGNKNPQPAGPVFPNLDSLYVRDCNLLKSVESSSAVSFRNLTTLRVWGCGGLEYLATYSVAKSLMQLTTLEVGSCERLREIIVASTEDDHCEIAFSRLQHLELYNLPRLQGFCSGKCIVKLPSSTKLNVDCPIELKISSQGVLLSNSKPEPTEYYDDDDDDDNTDIKPFLYAAQ